MPIWSWIRGKGGNPDEEADLLEEEGGGEDPGEADEKWMADGAGYGMGFAAGDASQVAQADLDEFKPPREY
jgi:hypothetical protein